MEWYDEGNSLTDNIVLKNLFNEFLKQNYNFNLEIHDNAKLVTIDTYLINVIIENKLGFMGSKDPFIKILIKNLNENYFFQNNLSKIELIINEDELLYKELSSVNKKIKEFFKKIYNEYLIDTIGNKDHVICKLRRKYRKFD